MTFATAIDKAGEFLADTPVPFYAGGRWRQGSTGATEHVFRPSDGSVLTTVALASAADVDTAVESATAAFPAWSRLSSADRAVLLHRLADLMERDQHVLASLESKDLGKSAAEALDFDILFAAQGYRYYADVATHSSSRVALPIRGIEAQQLLQPRGACGFIIPWNAPSILTAWGIAPALAAGNTVVVKAAELAPLTPLYLCRLADEAGIPPGVINVLVGTGAEAGAALAGHPRIKYLSFTGSPATGKLVAAAAAGNLTPSKMELGGKGAAVVFPDVDIQDTATKLAAAITRNAGQTCCTATRWLIHESILDEFVEAAVASLRSTRLGADDDSATELGAVISQGQRNRIQGYLDDGVAQGAEWILKGGSTGIPGHENGFYVSPALLTGDPANVCAREEIFGPVGYVIPFNDRSDVVSMVNESNYGLANSVWTTDLTFAYEVAGQLVSGNSWINAHNVFAYGLPYGGVNLSGWGGGVNSLQTYFDYLRPMTVARPLDLGPAR